MALNDEEVLSRFPTASNSLIVYSCTSVIVTATPALSLAESGDKAWTRTCGARTGCRGRLGSRAKLNGTNAPPPPILSKLIGAKSALDPASYSTLAISSVSLWVAGVDSYGVSVNCRYCVRSASANCSESPVNTPGDGRRRSMDAGHRTLVTAQGLLIALTTNPADELSRRKRAPQPDAVYGRPVSTRETESADYTDNISRVPPTSYLFVPFNKNW